MLYRVMRENMREFGVQLVLFIIPARPSQTLRLGFCTELIDSDPLLR